MTQDFEELAVDRRGKRYVDISDPGFSERLRRYRHAAGFTRKRLRYESGVSERTLIKYESGKAKGAKDSTLLAICRALGIGLEDLVPQKKTQVTEQDAVNRSEDVKKPVNRPSRKRLVLGIAGLAVILTAWGVLSVKLAPSRLISGADTTGIGGNFSPDFATINASRYYTEGLENLKRLYRDEAREGFRLALEHDSTHAMSYVMLLHPNIRGTRDESLRLIAKAHAYEHRLDRREKLFLGAMEALVDKNRTGAVDILEELVTLDPRQSEAFRILAQLYTNRGNYPEAIGCLNAAVTADTSDGMSYNRLAYVYLKLGRYDKALAAVDRYMKLSPAEPNPYDTRGDILADMGRIDDAIACYEAALARKHDFFPSLQNLGQMHFFKGDHEESARYYKKLGEVDDRGARCRSRLFLACIPLYKGKLDEALERLDQCEYARNGKSSSLKNCMPNAVLRSQIMLEMGEKERALREFERAISEFVNGEGFGSLGWPIYYTQFLSEVDMPRAKEYVDGLKTVIDQYAPEQEYKYWFCRGWIELRESRPEEAIMYLKRADDMSGLFYVRYQLGQAYLASRQPGKAIEAFESALNTNTHDKLKFGIWSVKAHYYLGVAFMEDGQLDRADKKFSEFLELWKDADWEFEEIALAGEHRTRLSLSMGASN